jgi:predicted solute-binding protein
MMAAGELDVALVSSFEFLRNPIYTIVNDVAVASDGPVHSVFLAHEGRLDEIEEIALDPASQTAVNLLRCLLGERKLSPSVVTDLPGAETSITRRRARLMIGDQAIHFRGQDRAECNFWDLGAEWQRMIGLPFVFALWLIRPEVEHANLVAEALRTCRDRNVCSIDRVIAAQTSFPPEFCDRYFREHLRFGFAAAEKEGLLKFGSLCEKHGSLRVNGADLHFV